jgi:hypothetical protein
VSEERELLFRIRTEIEDVNKIRDATEKVERAHISTTELRRNLSMLRRDMSLLVSFLESQGVKLDDNGKKAVSLFNECMMLIADSARIITMLNNIGMAANSALGILGLVIEAVTILNQIYAGNNYGMQVRTAVQQATGIPGVGPGFLWGLQTGPYGLTPGLLSGARWRETG